AIQVQASSAENLAPGFASAMDIDSSYLENAVFDDNEISTSIVSGRKGFLAPIQGDTFLIISSGTAQPYAYPDGWLGTPEDSLSAYNNNPSGTGPLGGEGYEITTLSFTLRAPEWANSLSFNFRFMSEEYPEYVDDEFNDFFSCLLDGENIVFDTQGKIINVNNNFFDPNISTEGTVFNAATILLKAKVGIDGGSTFDLIFIVGDVGDDDLDSAVFLDNFSFSGDEVSGSTTVPDSSVYNDSNREARSLSVIGAVGIGVTAATVIVTVLGPAINAAIMSLPIPSQLRSFLKFYGASLFQKVDKVKLKTLEKAPFITKDELIALGISISLVTIIYSFVQTNGIQQFLNPSVLAVVIPSTFASVCIVTITKVFSDAFCAGTCNIYRKFNLWITGVITFIISGILFLFPFSSPGITRYQSLEITKETKGLLILSKTLILLTLTIPFSILFLMDFKIVSDSGILLTLMSASYSLVPLKYLSGKVVFDYNKKYSLIAFGSTTFLFISFTINLLPILAYFPVGIVSTILTVITLKKLRLSKQESKILN
ncbi:choice-of-anchor L domain-containing protein, partial [Thermoproteota archaeon]